LHGPWNNDNIEFFKSVLFDQQVTINFGIHSDNFGTNQASPNNNILSSSEMINTGSNHAQTIVGYDNSISEGGNVGAFKVVNSWGTSWGNSGYYWITYEAFKKTTSFVSWLRISPNYDPSLTAIWEFNPGGARDAPITVGLGSYSNPSKTKSHTFDGGTYIFPSFMCIDITEFEDEYLAGNNEFFLEIESGASPSTIAEFWIEYYDWNEQHRYYSIYSQDTPKTTPGYVTVRGPFGSSPPVFPTVTIFIRQIGIIDEMEGMVGEGGADWYYYTCLYDSKYSWTPRQTAPADTDNPILNRNHPFMSTKLSASPIIMLCEEDFWSADDLADISSDSSGGVDNVASPITPPGSGRYGGSYRGFYDLKTNTLTGDTWSWSGGYRLTSGNYDGSTSVDENDAALWFDITDNYYLPVANAGGNRIINTTIMFNGNLSTASPGSSLMSYFWDFGDGTSSTEISPTHEYTMEGIFRVTLTITDSMGESDTDSCLITVQGLSTLIKSRLPIRIYSNADFNEEHGVANWDTGEGTRENPWVIENWYIYGGGYGNCIFIGNTLEHYVIRNCTLNNASGNPGMYYWDSGLSLYNTTNGAVYNNSISHNQGGIVMVFSTTNNAIINNTITSNYEGMILEYLACDNTISNNTISRNENSGIHMEDNCSFNIIINNIFSENGCYGILFEDNSSYNTIRNNTLISNNDVGILIAWNSNFNTIEKNQANDQMGGIAVVDGSTHNTLKENRVSNNTYGIILSSAVNNSVYYNNASYNVIGIAMVYFSLNNTITHNIITNNYAGIIMEDYVSYNNIRFNTMSMNEEYDIGMESQCNHNIIANNTAISSNAIGIGIFSSCNFNTIKGNVASNQTLGIVVSDYCYYNTIIENMVKNNTYGIYLANVTNNSVYHNNIINNTIQSYDDGYNHWDNGYPSGGNYWSNYNGTDRYSGILQDCPFSDGIGDAPYMFGYRMDQYPLTLPWGSPPEPIRFFKELTLGWNLISIPLETEDTSVMSVLSSIGGKWDVVRYYDGITKVWKTYRVGSSVNTLERIDCSMGIWLHTTESCTLIVSGQKPTSTSITLYTGWNLVGYPSQAEQMVAFAMWGTGVDRVEVFDDISPYIKEAEPSYVMKLGDGYWVHVPADTVWTVDW
jgi:parallel beta-helix repeat protein